MKTNLRVKPGWCASKRGSKSPFCTQIERDFELKARTLNHEQGSYREFL